MDAPRAHTPAERPLEILFELRLADSTACFGGSGRYHRCDGYCVALDVATLGASGCRCFVSALLTANGQSMISDTISQRNRDPQLSQTALALMDGSKRYGEFFAGKENVNRFPRHKARSHWPHASTVAVGLPAASSTADAPIAIDRDIAARTLQSSW
jgi:hypothetical protein